MLLPKQFQFLAHEPAPKMLVEAVKLYGIKEIAGSASNPLIMAWAKELGLHDYTGDAIAWCGLFMALVAKRAGKVVNFPPLWALNWSHFGSKIIIPMLSDVLVFSRPGGGHVGMYAGEDKHNFWVLGGNESDQVNIVPVSKIRLVAARRPDYSIGIPPNVRRIFIDDNGPVNVSTNEA